MVACGEVLSMSGVFACDIFSSIFVRVVLTISHAVVVSRSAVLTCRGRFHTESLISYVAFQFCRRDFQTAVRWLPLLDKISIGELLSASEVLRV